MRVEDFDTANDGRLSYIRGRDVSIGILRNVNGRSRSEKEKDSLAEKASALLKDADHILRIGETVNLQVIGEFHADPSSQELSSIHLQQYLNAIPVEGQLTLHFDPRSGRVKHFSGLPAKSSMAEDDARSWYRAEEAQQLIRDALASRPDIKGTLSFKEPLLTYRYVSDTNLDPFYEFYVSASESGTYAAFVNALTGQVDIGSPGINFRHQLCYASDKGDLVEDCEEEEAINLLVEPLSAGDPCVASADRDHQCTEEYYRHLYDLTQEIEDTWDTQFGGDCCFEFGSGVYDIVIDSRKGPLYSPSEHAIIYPHPSEIDVFQSGTYPTGIYRVHIHEMFHAYQHKYNAGLVQRASSGDKIAKSLLEGTADIAAAIYTDSPQWVFAHGELKVSRDLTVPRTINNFSTAPDAEHYNGKIWGYLFYEISTRSGVSLANLRKLLAKTVRNLDHNSDGTPGYSFKDVENAVKSAASQLQDSSLQSAVSAVWDEVDTSTSASAPSAPSAVNGYFVSCSSNTNNYWNFWSGVTGASSYQVYYSTDFNQWYYSNTTSATGGPSASTADVHVKVRACGGPGCSALSASSFFQQDICGG